MCNAIAAAGNIGFISNIVARADVLAAAGSYSCFIKCYVCVIGDVVIGMYAAKPYYSGFKSVSCKIYFIRDVESPDESLLTAEVRNNKIVQVRGKFNRHPNDIENTFISQWAINKNLKIDY